MCLCNYRGCLLGSHSYTVWVKVDANKINAIALWPRPTSPRALRRFLCLAGYYRKFVKDYGLIVKPLTNLLRKNSFIWTEEASLAFQQLQAAMTATPVLALPDFSIQFVVECDASEAGIGAILLQKERPVAFLAKH